MDLREKLEAFLAAHPNEKTGEPMSPTRFDQLYGVKRQNLEHILKGSSRTPTNADVRSKLARALGMTVEQLLDPTVSYPLDVAQQMVGTPTAAPGKPEFAQRFAGAMRERNFTAAKLAKGLDIPKGRVDAWLREDGDMPSAAQLFAIADALPASPRWLATGVGELSGTDVAVPLRVEVEGDEFKLLQLFRLMREPEREKLLSYAKWVIDNTPLPDNVVPLEPTSNGKPRRR